MIAQHCGMGAVKDLQGRFDYILLWFFRDLVFMSLFLPDLRLCATQSSAPPVSRHTH